MLLVGKPPPPPPPDTHMGSVVLCRFVAKKEPNAKDKLPLALKPYYILQEMPRLMDDRVRMLHVLPIEYMSLEPSLPRRIRTVSGGYRSIASAACVPATSGTAPTVTVEGFEPWTTTRLMTFGLATQWHSIYVARSNVVSRETRSGSLAGCLAFDASAGREHTCPPPDPCPPQLKTPLAKVTASAPISMEFENIWAGKATLKRKIFYSSLKL